jgi:hypothetical protein
MLKLQALPLVLLGVVGLVDGSTLQNITSDTFFYGQSPPVYPSRKFRYPAELGMSIYVFHSSWKRHRRLGFSICQGCSYGVENDAGGEGWSLRDTDSKEGLTKAHSPILPLASQVKRIVAQGISLLLHVWVFRVSVGKMRVMV